MCVRVRQHGLSASVTATWRLRKPSASSQPAWTAVCMFFRAALVRRRLECPM